MGENSAAVFPRITEELQELRPPRACPLLDCVDGSGVTFKLWMSVAAVQSKPVGARAEQDGWAKAIMKVHISIIIKACETENLPAHPSNPNPV